MADKESPITGSRPRHPLQAAERLRREGSPEEALVLLEEELRHRPRYVGARVARGRCLLELLRIGEGLEVLEQVVAEDPSHLVASRLLVRGCLAKGDVASARTWLDRYALLCPGDPELRQLQDELAALEEEGCGERTESPSAPEVTATLGELYLEQGHPAEAAAIFRRLLAVDPANTRAREGLSRVSPGDGAHVAGKGSESSSDVELAGERTKPVGSRYSPGRE